MILQFLTTTGVLSGELAFGGNAGPVTITNSQLVALCAAETDLELRPFTRWRA